MLEGRFTIQVAARQNPSVAAAPTDAGQSKAAGLSFADFALAEIFRALQAVDAWQLYRTKRSSTIINYELTVDN